SIAEAELRRALAAKLKLAAEQGLAPWIVTQFGFEPAAIAAWLRARGGEGNPIPVRIGLAGPANIATLVRFAIRCGVTNSIRARPARPGRFSRWAGDNAPATLVGGVAEAAPAGAELLRDVAGLHFFPFGGVARTARWANALKRGRFRLASGGGLDAEL